MGKINCRWRERIYEWNLKRIYAYAERSYCEGNRVTTTIEELIDGILEKDRSKYSLNKPHQLN